MTDGTPLLEKIQNLVKPSSEYSNMDQNTHSGYPNDTTSSAYDNMQSMERTAADSEVGSVPGLGQTIVADLALLQSRIWATIRCCTDPLL